MTTLLLDLDQSLHILGLETYGLTLTTLEEVFLKVSAGLNGEAPDVPVATPFAFNTTPKRPSAWVQLLVTLRWRLVLARRSWRYNLGSSIMPAIFVLFSLILQYYLDEDMAPKTVDTSSIVGGSDLWWSASNGTLPQCLLDGGGELMQHHSVFVGHSEDRLKHSLLEQARFGDPNKSPGAAFHLGNGSTCVGSEDEDYPGASFNGSWTLHFNQSHVNSLPAYLSFMEGATLLGDGAAFDLSAATFEPKDDSYSMGDVGVALTLTYLIGFEFASFTTTFAYDSVADRKEGRLHQLRVSGVHSFSIWGSLALIDLTRWCIPFILIFSLIAGWGSEMLVGHGAAAALMLAMLFVGLQTVLMGYSLGCFISDPEFISNSLGSISFLVTMVLFTATYTVLSDEVGFPAHFWPAGCGIIVFGGMLFPAFLIMCAFTAVMHLSGFGTNFPESSKAFFSWTTQCTAVEENMCPGIIPIVL
jgi:hypothetical protein